MTSLITRTIAASLIGVTAFASLQAQDRSSAASDIGVNERTHAFAQGVAERLDYQLNRRTLRPDSGSGVVQIFFVANAEGRSQDVTLVESCGEQKLDRAVLRAVSRLHGMMPPVGEGGQAILATVVIADDEREAVQLARQFEDGAEGQLTARLAEPNLLDLTLMPAPRS